MAGYVRQSAADIAPGKDVAAGPVNDEFNQLEAAFNATSGHTHDGTSGNGPKINLTTAVTGVLPKTNGGTGTTTGAVTAPGSTVTDKSVVGFDGTSGEAVLQLTPAEVRTYAELGTMALEDAADFQPQNSSLDEISSLTFANKDILQYRTGSGITNRTLAQLLTDLRDEGIFPYIHAQDEKPSGTPGGYSGSPMMDGWYRRTLNTVKSNSISGASLSSDKITLPAGTYYAYAEGPFVYSTSGNITRTVMRIYNVTDSSTLIRGTNNGVPAGVASVSGYFTLAGSKEISVDQFISTSNVGIDYFWGLPNEFSPEIYARAFFWKVK